MVSLNVKGNPYQVVKKPLTRYLCSVVDIDLEMYATGQRSPVGCLCRSIPPSLYEDASAETIVSLPGLNSTNVGLSVISFYVSKGRLSCPLREDLISAK